MILKHRDKNILRFEWLEPFGVHVLEVFEENLKFLPLEMKGAATDDALWSWLKHRIASYNRWNILTLHSVLRLRFRSVRDVIVCCKALSLNDVFWVVEDDFNGQWSQFSLYQNRLDVNVASWTLTEKCKGRITRQNLSTPELTTAGRLPKCWRRTRDKVLLYKAGHCYKELQPYSEFYASQVANILGLHCVKYGLSKYKGIICSTCELFTSDKFSFIPVGRLYDFNDALKDGRFSDMFLFDWIIGNVDRHLGNFGFIVDNDTNDIVDIAPVFDNGESLFVTEKVFPKLVRYPLKITHAQQQNLEKLLNFRFKKHPRHNLSEDRLHAMELRIRVQVQKLLKNQRKAA